VDPVLPADGAAAGGDVREVRMIDALDTRQVEVRFGRQLSAQPPDEGPSVSIRKAAAR
jgi:hypothetical protein